MPEPLSSALVTIMVFPFGIGVIVCVGSIGVAVIDIKVGVDDTTVGVFVIVVTAGDGLAPQPFKTRPRMITKRKDKVKFFFFID